MRLILVCFRMLCFTCPRYDKLTPPRLEKGHKKYAPGSFQGHDFIFFPAVPGAVCFSRPAAVPAPLPCRPAVWPVLPAVPRTMRHIWRTVRSPRDRLPSCPGSPSRTDYPLCSFLRPLHQVEYVHLVHFRVQPFLGLGVVFRVDLESPEFHPGPVAGDQA